MRKIAVAVLAVSLPFVASAERRNPLDGQPAVRDRVEMRKLRFEITPAFQTSINQDYKHAFGPGLQLQFHILDWIGIGVQGFYTFSANTSVENEVRTAIENIPSYMSGGPPTLAMHDERILSIDGYFAAYALVTPFSGKFGLFSKLFVNYDLYAKLGVGILHFKQDNCCNNVQNQPPGIPDPNFDDPSIFAGFKVAFYLGIGAHMFFNNWIGLQFELTNYLTRANPGGGDFNGDRRLASDSQKPADAPNVASDERSYSALNFSLGIVLMMPPKARITH